MKKILPVPYFAQTTTYTCGPAALRMLFSYLGKEESEEELTKTSQTNEAKGTKCDDLLAAAQKEGFISTAHTGSSIQELKDAVEHETPAIVNYMDQDNEGHFAVVVGYDAAHLILNDPTYGANYAIENEQFLHSWKGGFDDSDKERWMLIVTKENSVGKK